MTNYDLLYQDWLIAKRSKDYNEADRIRTEFERLHGLTIFKEGDMPIEGVTVRRMLERDWQKQYGKPGVAKHTADWDSFIASKVPYKGMSAIGGTDYRRNYEITNR